MMKMTSIGLQMKKNIVILLLGKFHENFRAKTLRKVSHINGDLMHRECVTKGVNMLNNC